MDDFCFHCIAGLNCSETVNDGTFGVAQPLLKRGYWITPSLHDNPNSATCEAVLLRHSKELSIARLQLECNTGLSVYKCEVNDILRYLLRSG